jgi:putative FmdB family regulatory protein
MPYYDLRCESCQHAFHVKASIQERSEGLLRCPVCGAANLANIYRRVNVLRYHGKDCDACAAEAPATGCGCSGDTCFRRQG